jgi:hypothetical protein
MELPTTSYSALPQFHLCCPVVAEQWKNTEEAGASSSFRRNEQIESTLLTIVGACMNTRNVQIAISSIITRKLNAQLF